MVIGSISAAAVVGCGLLVVLFYKATSKSKRNSKRLPVREKVDAMLREGEQSELCSAVGAHAFSSESLAEGMLIRLGAEVSHVDSSVTEKPTSVAPCTTNDDMNNIINPSVKQKRIVLKTYSDDDFSGANSLFDEIMAELNEQSEINYD